MAKSEKYCCKQWQEVLDTLIFSATKGDTLQNIENLHTEADLIRYFTDDCFKTELLKWIGDVYTASSWKKSSEKAKLLREEGNKKYQLKDYVNCVNIYTESIKYAPPQSEELSLSLANRSAVLFNTGYYEGAIIDIELAFAHGYPQHLRYKLHQRKGECLAQLGKYQDAIEEFGLAQKILQNTKDMPEEKTSPILKSIKSFINDAKAQLPAVNLHTRVESTIMPELPVPLQGVNEEFACASKAVSLRNSKEKGRHVIALCDINVGDVLFVEKPFASVLLPDHYQYRCHHCCSLFKVPMPCWECTTVLYCSESCRKNSWSEYHRWECCGGLDIVHRVGIAHLGLRVVLKAGAVSDHQALKIMLEENKSEGNEHYFAVYHLVTHLKNMSAYDRASYALTAVCLMLYLDHYTDYFCGNTSNTVLNGEAPNDVNDSILIGCNLLHHICQLVCNGHAITAIQEKKSNEYHPVVQEKQVRVATAIFPSASMMNHSCDSNIINSFHGTHLIVKAYKNIRKGQEVFNCYGPNFRRMDKKERQKSLEAQYYFECQCEVCTSDDDFLEIFSALLCEVCNGPIPRKICKERKVKCINCGSSYESSALFADSLRAHYAFDKGHELMRTDQFRFAIETLQRCHEIHKTCLYKSNVERRLCLDSLAKCYAELGEYTNTTKCLEETLPAIEEQYGLLSIEMAHELQKLTDSMICELNFNRCDKDSFQKKHAETLKYVLKAKEIFQLHYGLWNPSLQDVIRKEEDLNTMLNSMNMSSF